MNPHTMNRSLTLSRWKHTVDTSLSSASRQMGRLYFLRQKSRLHWSHEAEAARFSRGLRSARRREGWLSEAGPSSMMVELVKQVHLQKVGMSGGRFMSALGGRFWGMGDRGWGRTGCAEGDEGEEEE